MSYDENDMKKWVGDALVITGEVKTKKGGSITLTSSNHCISMYLQAYLDNCISKEVLLNTVKSMNPRPSKEMIDYVMEKIKEKEFKKGK